MTFSIVGRDADGREMGVAVASRFLAAGAHVPAASAAAGALATQAYGNLELRTRGPEMLAGGLSAGAVLDAVEPALIMGSTAADLAHLLAELVENALTYSPPREPVMVGGRWLDRDGYRLTVVDQGIGMSAEAVEAANRRLGGDESYTVAPSKNLGHYVAGNLAVRHGIRVQVAAVDLPFALLVREDQPGLPAAAGPY